MENHWWARFWTLCLFSGGIGALLAVDSRHKHAVSKAVFLQREAQLYDKSLANAHPVAEAIGMMLFVAFFFALYELIAFAILKIFFRAKPSATLPY
jgi:hypothetical protein